MFTVKQGLCTEVFFRQEMQITLTSLIINSVRQFPEVNSQEFVSFIVPVMTLAHYVVTVLNYATALY